MKKKQIIMYLMVFAAILFLALLHVILSKNIGPVQQIVEKTIHSSSVQVYESY